jgi:DNA-binding CsgD family transcriptional regulator
MFEEPGLAYATPSTADSSMRYASRYIGPERRAGFTPQRTIFSRQVPAPTPPRRSPLSTGLLALMLDEVTHGMLLLNAQGHVVHANHAARIEMDQAHPLQDTGGLLRARSTRDNGALVQALSSANRDQRRCLLTLGEAGRQLTVAVVPLRSNCAAQGMQLAGALAGEAATLLVFGKRQVCETLSVQWFAQQHRLTLAETQVLQAFCGGATPGEVARQQGVAMSTVRSQLSSIRAKTGASDLRVLARQVAVLPPLLSALRHR